jgi:hypothetical protein
MTESHVRPLAAAPGLKRRMLGDFMYLTQRDTIPTRKTAIYDVFNSRSRERLGTVHFYAIWRQFVFSPAEETIFNTQCLGLIKEFVDELNVARRKQ